MTTIFFLNFPLFYCFIIFYYYVYIKLLHFKQEIHTKTNNTMTNLPPKVDTINQLAISAKNRGIYQLKVDQQNGGREIFIQGKKLISFGSCSYLSLENENFVKNASIKAINDFGTQFSCSRSFLGLSLYDELEDTLEQMFGYPTVVTSTISLGHIAAVPLLVQPDDAVIMDHQVHASVGNAVQIAKAAGTHVEMIRHNNMEMLEQRIQKLSKKHNQIWYMADGIYSMYGDKAPIKALYALLEKYEKFHLYIDDAHGMSWTGKNGCGYILSQVDLHPRMIVGASFSKSFGSGGGAFICPNEETKELITNCGSTLIFSGPIQPAVLGASIASAKFHLTDALPKRQEVLKSKISYFIQEANRLELPLIGEEETPVFFIGVGKPEIGFELCQRMIKLGYYLNIAAYPAVPYKNTGLRMTITYNTTKEDITSMLSLLAIELDKALKIHDSSRIEVFKAFRKKQVQLSKRKLAKSF